MSKIRKTSSYLPACSALSLLAYFMQRPGRAIGRETLLRQVWGYEEPVDSHTIETHIRRLRAKLEPAPAQPELLQTVRGFGYRLLELEG